MMDFKEHMVVEKWKDTSTEDIITLMELTKGFLSTQKESVLFYVGLVSFLIAPFTMAVIGGFTTDAMIGFIIAFVSYIFVWKGFVRKKFYNEEAAKEFKLQIEELETVLKHR